MANKKITQLDALTSAAAAEGDVLPIVDLDADQTKKIQLGDLKSGSFVGTSTGLAGQPSIVVTNITASGTVSMLTASIGGGIFTSASLAAGSGGGGSAFPFTGSAGITGSINLVGPISQSGDISGSGTITAGRLTADSTVTCQVVEPSLGTGKLLLQSLGGTIGITGSDGVAIKTGPLPSTGSIDINSQKHFTNTVAGAYHLIASEGIRITGSGGGSHPIELDSGLEDGVFIKGGSNSVNIDSGNNIILSGSDIKSSCGNGFWVKNHGSNGIKITGSNISSEGIHMFPGFEAPIFLQSALGEIKLQSDVGIRQIALGDFEVTSSGTNGFRVTSSKFSIAGSGNSEMRLEGGNLNIQGSNTGDVTINAGSLRTLFLASEGGTISENAATIFLEDESLTQRIHISSSAIHVLSENQVFIFNQGLPTTEPAIQGQLWVSGSGYGSASGSKYLMVKQ